MAGSSCQSLFSSFSQIDERLEPQEEPVVTRRKSTSDIVNLSRAADVTKEGWLHFRCHGDKMKVQAFNVVNSEHCYLRFRRWTEVVFHHCLLVFLCLCVSRISQNVIDRLGRNFVGRLGV